MKNILLVALLLPLSLMGQDVIVTTDHDTIACRIQFIAEGGMSFVPEGRSDPSKVMLSMLDSYKWNEVWNSATVTATEEPSIQTATTDAAVNRASGNSLSTGGAALVAAGCAATLGAGVLLAATIGKDDLSPGAVKGLQGAGFGMLALAGILTISAGFSIGKGGQDIKRVQLRAAGVQVR